MREMIVYSVRDGRMRLLVYAKALPLLELLAALLTFERAFCGALMKKSGARLHSSPQHRQQPLRLREIWIDFQGRLTLLAGIGVIAAVV